jgi:hypothetical protein
MLEEKDDLVGRKISLNGRKLAVVSHDKTKNMYEVLVLKNNCRQEEIKEGNRFKTTRSYLEEIGYEIIKEK